MAQGSIYLETQNSIALETHGSVALETQGSVALETGLRTSQGLIALANIEKTYPLEFEARARARRDVCTELAQYPCRGRAARSRRWACMHTDGADIASSRYHRNRITAPSQQRDQCAFMQSPSHANATLTQSEVYGLWIVVTPKGVSSSVMQRQARPLLVPARES
jgi:hypothetical protein